MSAGSDVRYIPPLPGPPVSGIRQGRWWLVAALLVGALVRLLWLATVDSQPVTDFDWYFNRATELAQGLGYQVDGKATAYWPVGYPAFLAIFFKVFGPSVAVGKALNFLLTLAAIPLAYALAGRLFRNRAVAAGTAMLLAIHPAFVAYSGILASEPLFTALTLGGTLALLQARDDRRRLVLGGLLFGLAVLVRPQAALIPVLVLAATWRWDDSSFRTFHLGRATGWAYLALILTISPWLVRNAVVFESFVFVSTNGGDNILIGNHEGATGRYKNPDACGLVRPPGLDEIEREKLARSAGLAYIRKHPLRTLRTWPAKLGFTFLSSTDVAYWAFQTEKGRLIEPGRGKDKPLYLATKDASAAATTGLVICAGASLAVLPWLRRRLKGRMFFPATAWLMISYSGLLSVGFFGNPRFAYPVIPFIAMLAVSLVVAIVYLIAGMPPAENEGDPGSTESQSS